ncbi:MAG: YlxR family protein [Catenulispora sp.]
MCVGCRKRSPVSELLRVVVAEGPSGPRIVPDPRRRLPGRGASLHRERACLDLAQRRRAFPRALRIPGPLDLAPLVEYVAQHARMAQSEQHPVSGVSEAGEPDEQPMKRQR